MPEIQPESEGKTRSRVSSVSSSTSSNDTPRRRTYAIAPVSMASASALQSHPQRTTPARSPRHSVGSPPSSVKTVADEFSGYMSELAAKEARVAELHEKQKAIQLELQAAEFDLRDFRQRGLRHLNEPKVTLSRATPTDLSSRVRESLSRSPSPQRKPTAANPSQMKRVVGELGTQFWSFVEDVRTAALGEDDAEGDWSDRGRPRSQIRDPDPNQYV